MAALLTLARTWEVAGRPEGDGPFVGGFDPWRQTVGGILAGAGGLSLLECTLIVPRLA